MISFCFRSEIKISTYYFSTYIGWIIPLPYLTEVKASKKSIFVRQLQFFEFFSSHLLLIGKLFNFFGEFVVQILFIEIPPFSFSKFSKFCGNFRKSEFARREDEKLAKKIARNVKGNKCIYIKYTHFTEKLKKCFHIPL